MKVRVIRVPDCDTRITRNNFGFCKLLPEIPEQNSSFGYSGFGFGYSGFGFRVTGFLPSPGATGHVRCIRGLQLELASLGNSFQLLRYNSPDCPVYTGLSGVPPDMSGASEDSNSNSPASGIHFSCSAIIHRTVRCTPDCPV
jgi:hypothetical protein